MPRSERPKDSSLAIDRRNSAGRAPAGFTLIELMVSIALALILILGVNQVFKLTSDTIGATEAFEATVREDRALQATMAEDFKGAIANQPYFIIDQFINYAFRNTADMASDVDQNPWTYDATQSGAEVSVNAYDYGVRSHRLDILNFFASGLFHRQTGDDGVYASSTTSTDAWIWYGPLRIYNRNAEGLGEYKLSGGSNGRGSYPYPGDLPTTASGLSATAYNPTNLFASQWMLGRVQMLLLPTPGENYVFRATNADPTTMSPLAEDSQTTLPNAPDGTQWIIQHHRLDLAGTSTANMRTYATARQNSMQLTPFILPPTAPMYANWLNPNPGGGHLSYRFAANPFIVRPAEARKMAQAAPVVAAGCTQFIVEYAGDYVKQNDDGTIAAPTDPKDPSKFGDGQIDFIAQAIPGTTPPKYTKTIRWYGMPRDTGSAISSVSAGRPDGSIDVAYDVAPLAYFTGVQYPFEKTLPPAPNGGNFAPIYATSKSSPTPEYFCGWGPYEAGIGWVPKMIRITVTIDDPNGRMTSGQTYEYVFQLGV